MATHSDNKIIQISSGTIIKGLLIGIAFFAFYYLRDLVLVVLLAVIIASAVEPATQWFLRRGVPRILVKPGSTYFSTSRPDSDAVPTANPPFSGSSNSAALLRILPDVTGSRILKMAATKPEVLISQLLD
jgi:hypothetical protein